MLPAASKSTKNRSKIGIENVFVLKSLFKSLQNRSWTEFGPILDPRWPGFFSGFWFRLRYGQSTRIQRPFRTISEPIWSRFGTILGPFRDHFGTIFGTILLHLYMNIRHRGFSHTVRVHRPRNCSWLCLLHQHPGFV